MEEVKPSKVINRIERKIIKQNQDSKAVDLIKQLDAIRQKISKFQESKSTKSFSELSNEEKKILRINCKKDELYSQMLLDRKKFKKDKISYLSKINQDYKLAIESL